MNEWGELMVAGDGLIASYGDGDNEQRFTVCEPATLSLDLFGLQRMIIVGS
jgi:hypothetical protein